MITHQKGAIRETQTQTSSHVDLHSLFSPLIPATTKQCTETRQYSRGNTPIHKKPPRLPEQHTGTPSPMAAPAFLRHLLRTPGFTCSIVGNCRVLCDFTGIGLMDVIAIMNRKGGVGKTTVALNLAIELAARGHRVLAFDNDAQGSLTTAAGLDAAVANDPDATLGVVAAHVLEARRTGVKPAFGLTPAILPSPAGPLGERTSLSFVAATSLLGAIEDTAVTMWATWEANGGKSYYPYSLYFDLLKEVNDRFDFVIIDCPPGNPAATKCAYRAANWLLPVSQVHALSIKKLDEVFSQYQSFKETGLTSCAFLGVIFSMVDKRKSFHRARLADWLSQEGVVPHHIEYLEIWEESSRAHASVKEMHESRSRGDVGRRATQQLVSITDELLSTINNQKVS
jgi:chromosome partitioning protein